MATVIFFLFRWSDLGSRKTLSFEGTDGKKRGGIYENEGPTLIFQEKY